MRLHTVSLVLLALWMPVQVAGEQQASPPAAPREVSGNERIAWDQVASSIEELGELTFYSYVDGFRELLDNVRCASEPDPIVGFECSARLPRMAPGIRTIFLVAVRGPGMPGDRSIGLTVLLRPRTADGPSLPNRFPIDDAAGRIVSDLVDVRALSALPDGRALAGEESGRIHTIDADGIKTAIDLRSIDRSDAPLRLLALAVAPDFARSRSIFVAYHTGRGLRLARLTESNGLLVNRAIIRENLSVPAEASVAMSFGPDAKLYVAIPGRVLRLNVDGTPSDARSSEVFAESVAQPVDMAWSFDENVLWVLGSAGDLRSIAGGTASGRALASYRLADDDATAMALLPRPADGGQLMIAKRSTMDLLLWRASSSGGLDRETKFNHNIGEVVAMARETGNTLWIATRSSVYRLTIPH
jgi:hypothetical protein